MHKEERRLRHDWRGHCLKMIRGMNSRKKDRKSCFQRSFPSISKKSYKYDSKNVLLVSANRTGFANYFEAQSPIEEVWSLRFNYHSNLYTLITPAKISWIGCLALLLVRIHVHKALVQWESQEVLQQEGWEICITEHENQASLSKWMVHQVIPNALTSYHSIIPRKNPPESKETNYHLKEWSDNNCSLYRSHRLLKPLITSHKCDRKIIINSNLTLLTFLVLFPK